MAFMSCSSRVVSARCAQVLRPDTRVMVARAGREHPAASRAPPRLVPLSGVGAAVLARRGCAGRRAVRAAAAGQVDRHLEVKLGIAQGTGKLDLSEMGLTEIPAEVFYLTELTVRAPTNQPQANARSLPAAQPYTGAVKSAAVV